MKFLNLPHIEQLKTIINDSLEGLINKDYVLLDIPNHRNIGDTLIWQGELDYLKNINQKMVYTSNAFTFNVDKIPSHATILLHGGGNFGDVWRLNQEFRNDVVRRFKQNRIVLFPQTVHYADIKNLENDAKLYNQHPDLILCARDNRSYKILSEYFDRCTILKLPDMAFCLNLIENHSDINTGKDLILKRMDKELGDQSSIDNVVKKLSAENKVFDIADWPGFYAPGTLKRRLQAYAIKGEIKLSEALLNKALVGQFVDDVYGLKRRDNKERLLKKGMNFINNYDTIYSTRLHGFILSVLLNKKAIIFDNSYGKNSNFFKTWMTEFENVELI